jgi:hypothetical protein
MNSETGGTKVSEDTDSQGVPAIAAPMRRKDEAPVLLGEPKGIRYHATRLRDMEHGRSGKSASQRSISFEPLWLNELGDRRN